MSPAMMPQWWLPMVPRLSQYHHFMKPFVLLSLVAVLSLGVHRSTGAPAEETDIDFYLSVYEACLDELTG